MNNIDIDLLWQAYPKGYLGMSGVRTIGGYIGYGPWHDKANDKIRLAFRMPERGACFVEPGDTVQQVRAIAEMVGNGPDELLPAVDPDDVATWSCCLRDLAEACFAAAEEPAPKKRWWVSGWSRCMVPTVEHPDTNVSSHWTGGWGLRVSWGIAGIITMPFPFAMEDVEDPALALVTARIQMRERGQ